MLEVKFKHKVFSENREIGTFYSFSDSKDRAIGGALNLLERYHNLNDFPNWTQKFHFLFGAKSDTSSKLRSLYDHLRLNLDECVVLFLDSKGTKCILSIPSSQQQPLDTKHFPISFLCTVIDDKSIIQSTFSAQQASSNHYNLLVRTKEDRHNSQIFHLRNLNNWIKSAVIDYACRYLRKDSGVNVLDLGCGKGGDIGKWLKCGCGGLSHYVGVDIAKTSLIDFVDRIQQLPIQSQQKIVSLIEMDMGELTASFTASQLHTYNVQAKMWNKIVPFPVLINQQRLRFDIASCQFAVHYMFQSRQKARHFFSQINEQLASHGVIITTTVDSRVMSSLLLQQISQKPQITTNEKRSIQIYSELSSGQSNDQGGRSLILEITFQNEMWRRILDLSTSSSASSSLNPDPFGIEYQFSLFDQPPSVDSLNQQAAAVNAPEWLVPLGRELDELANDCGLEVILCENFHQYIENNLKNHSHLRDLMKEMNVFDINGSISRAEWEIAGLYVVLGFRKKSTTSGNDSLDIIPKSPPGPPPALFHPSSPPGPPPPSSSSSLKIPSSPPGPPPPQFFRPSSPLGPPPPPSTFIRPSSPPGPPPPQSSLPSFSRPSSADSDSDSDDEVLKLHLKVRSLAIKFCQADGVIWDDLSDEERESYLMKAKATLSGNAVPPPSPSSPRSSQSASFVSLKLPGDDEFCDFENSVQYTPFTFQEDGDIGNGNGQGNGSGNGNEDYQLTHPADKRRRLG